MEDTVDRIAQLKIQAKSPDRCVLATYTAHGGIRIQLDVMRLSSHNERSLAMQVKFVVRRVMAHYESQSAGIINAGMGGPAPEPGNTPQGQRRRDFERELARTLVLATSPRSYAKVLLGGAQVADCKIRPGTLASDGVSFSFLESEVNSALAKAATELNRKRVRLYRGICAPDFVRPSVGGHGHGPTAEAL